MSQLEKLYFLSPTALQNVFISLYGLNLKRQRYGSAFRAELQRLQKSKNYSAQQLQDLQEKEFVALCKFAKSFSPYYRKLLAGIEVKSLQDLLHIPILEKQTLISNFNEVRANGLNQNRITHISTSGTTGTPLRIPITTAGRQKNFAFFERLKEEAGLKIDSKAIVFAGRVFVAPESKFGPYWRKNYFNNSLLCSSYHLSPATFSDYYQAISAFQPDYVDSYPSSVSLLANYIIERNLPAIKLKAVITSSETLLDNQREVIEKAFECKVFDYYGNAEQAAFISQCKAGSYHIQSEYGLVEFVKPGTSEAANDGEPAEILCTGFTNYALPLIRYRIGDTAILSKQACSCGSHLPRVESIGGRMDDSIVSKDGRIVGRLDPVFKTLSGGIAEAQIVQESSEKLLLRVVPTTSFSNDDIKSIVEQIHLRTGRQFQISTEEMKQIPREANGKFRSVLVNSKTTNRKAYD